MTAKLNMDSFDEWELEEIHEKAEKEGWSESDIWPNEIDWQLQQFVRDNGGEDKWYATNGRVSFGSENAPKILVDLRDCNDGQKWDSYIEECRQNGDSEIEIKMRCKGQALGDLHELKSIIEKSNTSTSSVVIIWPYFALGNWHENDISLPTMDRIYSQGSGTAIYIQMDWDKEANTKPLYPMF